MHRKYTRKSMLPVNITPEYQWTLSPYFDSVAHKRYAGIGPP